MYVYMYVCTYVCIYIYVCVSCDLISIIFRNSINRMVFVMETQSLLEGKNGIIKFDLLELHALKV
jgi:hypothetical protein